MEEDSQQLARGFGRQATLLALLLAFAGCKKEETLPVVAATAAARADSIQGKPIQETGAAPAVDAKEVGQVLFREDLDGDGVAELVTLAQDSQELCIGKVCTPVMEVGPDNRKWRIVDLDRQDGRKELAWIDTGIEDDAMWQILTFGDGKINVSAPLFAGNEPHLPGDATLVTHNANCGLQETVTWRLEQGLLHKAETSKSGTYSEGLCAACPYVYVDTGKGFQLAGEILRFQRSPDMKDLQGLALPIPARTGASLRLRLAERKPETTFLDEIYLTVNGQRFSPVDCDEHVATVCAHDGREMIIAWGQYRDFVFQVGEIPPGARVVLWAYGYYLPDLH